jgi:microcystin-dependent protein
VSEPFLGEIRMFGFNFAPRGWLLCNGQVLSISQYTALFSLLGTTYGGNGTSTFALPNLESRVAIHQGQGSGLSPYVIGQEGGTESVTLLSTQMPQHNHTVATNNGAGTTSRPSGEFLARSTDNAYAAATDATTLSAAAIGQTGGSQPHNNIQPFLTVNFCIATTGVFPARN